MFMHIVRIRRGHKLLLAKQVTWTVLLFAGVTLLAWTPTFCDRFDRSLAFTGVVLSKDPISMDSPYGSGAVYFLRVRTDDGQVIRVHVSERLYRSATVGTRIAQRRGLLPTLEIIRIRQPEK